MRAFSLAVLALLAACPIHKAPAPPLPAPPPPTPAPPSTVQLRQSVPFGDLLGSFEANLPGSHPMDGAWTEVGYPTFIKKALTRHPLRLVANGATLEARVRYDYQLKIARRTAKPWPLSGYFYLLLQSCSGYLDVGLNIHLDLNARGGVLPDTKPAAPTGGGCYSGMLYERFVEPILRRSADVIDEKLSAITVVADQLDALWKDAANPISVGDGFVLVANPVSNFRGTLGTTTSSAEVSLGISAKPEFYAPGATVPAPAPSPRPDLEFHSLPEDLVFYFEGKLSFAELNRILREGLIGKQLEAGNKKARIKNVGIEAAGAQIRLRLELRGDVRAVVYLVGTLVYDANRYILKVPDLRYDVASDQLLTRIAVWLKNEAILEFLREHSRWPLGGKLGQAEVWIENGLNTALDGKACVDVTAIHPDHIYTSETDLHVRVSLQGDVTTAPTTPCGTSSKSWAKAIPDAEGTSRATLLKLALSTHDPDRRDELAVECKPTGSDTQACTLAITLSRLERSGLPPADLAALSNAQPVALVQFQKEACGTPGPSSTAPASNAEAPMIPEPITDAVCDCKKAVCIAAALKSAAQHSSCVAEGFAVEVSLRSAADGSWSVKPTGAPECAGATGRLSNDGQHWKLDFENLPSVCALRAHYDSAALALGEFKGCGAK